MCMIRLGMCWPGVGRADLSKRPALASASADEATPIGIVGGGAAGIFAAITCAEAGAARMRTGVVRDKRTRVMGYSSKQCVLENCEPMDKLIQFVMLAQSARLIMC
jgi:glycine/D-amino acid oxidase-like deaminating enzyme